MDVLELIRRIRTGQDEARAMEELYSVVRSELLDRLRRKIPPVLRSRLDGEDVLHWAFIKAIGALPTFEGSSESSFLGWVYKIGKNLIISMGRRLSVAQVPLPEGSGDGKPAGRVLAGQDSAQAEEVVNRDWIETMLSKLRDKEAELIRLRHLEGLSFEAIAERWQSTPGAVMRMHSRTCERLRALARSL
ncbi:MAG: sigma-70 family RNA polymerase sigma factor [Planctomycetes bacterium]|nr:sigma-70 family RNA polymerase sigma factor [Planctomycetota bacterium]